MNFLTHNDKNIEHFGSSYQGSIDISYEKLVNTFGKSDNWDTYKSDAEWCIEFENGVLATIYNYKDGVNYNGEEDGLEKEDITDWHIGGQSKESVRLVYEALGLEIEE